MLADVAEEIEHAHGRHPVGVVDEDGGIFRAGEVEQVAELAHDAGDVGVDGFLGEEIALGRFAARVADHAGGAAGEDDGLVSGELEPAEHDEAEEVAELEAAAGGIEADVERDGRGAGREEFFELVAVGHVGDEAAPFEFGEDRCGGHGRLCFSRKGWRRE